MNIRENSIIVDHRYVHLVYHGAAGTEIAAAPGTVQALGTVAVHPNDDPDKLQEAEDLGLKRASQV